MSKLKNGLVDDFMMEEIIMPIDTEEFHIKEVQLRLVSPIYFDVPFYDATMGPFDRYEPCFLRLIDATGFSGECEVPKNAILLFEELLLPIILARKKRTYSELHREMYWRIRNEGFRGEAALLLGHIDRVFYDLASKRNGLPLYKYLGGKSPLINAYGSGLGTNITGNDLIDQGLAWQERGFQTIKMKFGGFNTLISEDIERICSVRESLKPETRLAIDANQLMSLDRAMKLVRELESVNINIAWLEEPVHSASLTEIERLCEISSIKISYGESERSAKTFPSIVKAGVKHLQPIAGHISSIKEWLCIARLASSLQLDFSAGGVSFYNAPFNTLAGDGALLEYLEPVIGYVQDVFSIKPDIRNGQFILPDIPGIGVMVDWQRLDKEKRITNKQVWN